MNLQEFKIRKPEFVKEAKNCKNEFEFTRLAEKYNIKFGAGCFKKAYELFCNSKSGELNEDTLKNVAGGINTTELNLGEESTTIVEVL